MQGKLGRQQADTQVVEVDETHVALPSLLSCQIDEVSQRGHRSAQYSDLVAHRLQICQRLSDLEARRLHPCEVVVIEQCLGRFGARDIALVSIEERQPQGNREADRSELARYPKRGPRPPQERGIGAALQF